MRLTILTDLPSANEIIRMHWAERKRLRLRLAKEIWGRYLLDGYHGDIEKDRGKKVKKSVTITLYRKGRRFDKDNAYGAVKILIDALRDVGFVYNDSEKWLDLGVCQELDHEHPRTEIEIKNT
jgi:hypothetical protein